jgi:hypothetical protein
MENDQEKSNSDIILVAEKLGVICTKLELLEKTTQESRQTTATNNNRVVIALIGVITAQIGVKILGTPILLDIATALAILGAVLLAGALVLKYRIHRAGKALTLTGKFFVIMLGMLFITQVAVYFRDMQILDAQIIYFIRILQNISILIFAWKIITNHNIFTDTHDK